MSNLFSADTVRALVCTWNSPTNIQGVLYLLITTQMRLMNAVHTQTHTYDLLTWQLLVIRGCFIFMEEMNLSKREHVNNSSSFDYPWTRKRPQNAFEVFQKI